MLTTLDAGEGVRELGVLELISHWDGQAVVARHDEEADAWYFVALHDDRLGTPVGGCRMKVYDRPEDGLLDAMRLAEGMTAKWASIGLDFGGGKSVLALSRPLSDTERRGVIRRFGKLLNTLDGAYGTGEDLGTTPEDMALLASVSSHVVGLRREDQKPADPGPYTALGVFSGMRAALVHRFGSDTLQDRTVLIQGAGDVGVPLARLVAGAGGRVLVSDIEEVRARRLADVIEAEVVDVADLYRTRCDIFAPCAVGAVLNARTIPELRCEIVAGSANNQLETSADADRLLERGILYAPDYVINAGGAMAFGLIYRGTTDEDELQRRVAGLYETLLEIFSEAAESGESPLATAGERVRRVLEAAATT